MQKIIILVIILTLFTGCKNTEVMPMTTEIPDKEINFVDEYLDPNKEIYEITEKMFIEQVNDIYLNYKKYKDKYIKYQGFYHGYFTGENFYPLVIRYGPGCCASDLYVGFQILANEYPKEDEWVEIIGELVEFYVGDAPGYYIKVIKMTKIDNGNNFVYQ